MIVEYSLEWRDIKGYEGLYQVSNAGDIKSLRKLKYNGSGMFFQKEMILSQTNTSTGYKKVELTKEGKRKSHRVHRLVAEAFIPNIENKPYINHIDGNPINNKIENLEWVTQKENVNHAIDIGLKKLKFEFNYKELHSLYIEQKCTLKDIAKYYNTNETTIRRYLKKFKIKTRSYSESNTRYNINRDDIIEQLKTKNQKEIAKEIGCDPSLISKIINKK